MSRSFLNPGCLFLSTLLLAVPSAFPAADVIYVDENATGPVHNGSSWCQAFKELHEALLVAGADDMIRVADGVYTPDPAGFPDPRDATFLLSEPFTIAGAYAGCGAPDPDDRDPWSYITTLSGDLSRDDIAGTPPGVPPGIPVDNAYHVVTVASGVAPTLSGVVIRGGHAEGREGGGILTFGGRPILMVCTLEQNFAWRGGAIYAEGGEINLFQCKLTNNVTTGEGGAIFNATADLEAHNCLFALNSAGNDGGAIFSDLCATTFLNCSFGGNSSESRGGGMYLYVGVEAYAGNCIFWGNSDASGQGAESQIFINPSNMLNIDYSCIQGWAGGAGEGNIGDDPLVENLPEGDMHLTADSPCIDTGSNDLVTSQLDLDGNPRIVDETVDMGCYEYQGSSGVPDPGVEVAGILSISRRGGEAGLTVRFVAPHDGAWSLTVFSVTGQRLAELSRGYGGGDLREIIWDGRAASGRLLPNGVYLFTLNSGARLIDARKAVILR